ncbi:putative rRNA maturation factor YbeY [Neorickettsia helminthoeca str. Oregon]|uniref:Endoribonuclease YbeY n=1 Tax=Neorickettsia helminthoeca str. Oregon TaxID=1286528 RepID=X5HJE1_9RICK|nr:rRNA maturation RNase YbeY [Neorickettsia helminthoeca]AHX11194.1 putative rRNA maturation factor YbeY [Neorickettsia helminthoeca str. Oregon]
MDPRWKRKIAKDPKKLLEAVISQTLDGEKAEFSIVLTDDDFIRTLNRNYRGKDSATNVLSFNYTNEANCMGMIIGEVVLSFDRILIEALEYQIEFEEHFKHMLVHGILHILGYSHCTDEEALVMEKKERGILEKLHFTG